MYYDHQYDRMGKIESQRLALTNIVITVTVVAFTFGFRDANSLTVLNGVALPVTMVIANVFAVAYICRAAAFIHLHARRAKRTLELYAPALWELDKSMPWPRGPIFYGRSTVHVMLHVLLAAAATVPLIAYLCR